MTQPGRRATPVVQPLLLVLLAAVAVGVVVVLYDRGLLPIAGIFVALIVGPLLIYLRTWWLASRHRSLSRRATDKLTELLSLLEAERGLARDRRSSGATDESLDAALGQARTTLSQLSAGHEVAAADHVEALSRAREAWSTGAPVARGVERAVDLAHQQRRSRARIERERTRRAARRSGQPRP